MLFEVKQFEHSFKETTLKKGLKLFEKGAVELVEKQSRFDYHFFLEGDNLFLRKHGDKLMSYSCSCLKLTYCEHLSAVMFFFQQEALGISVKAKNSKLKKDSLELDENGYINRNIRKAESENLRKFIKESQNKLSVPVITKFLTDKKTLVISDVYCAQLEFLLTPYFNLKQLNAAATESLFKEFSLFAGAIAAKLKTEQDLFSFHIGIIKVFFQLFQMRFLGDEQPLFEIYDQTLNALDLLFKKGLTSKEKTEWFNVTLSSVSDNKKLQSEAFAFFVPRFVSFAKNEQELLVLSKLLKKRTFKSPHFQHLDKLLIARLQTALKEWTLFKTAFPLHQEGGEVELIIAKAELYFCKQNLKTAFNLLETHYDEIRISRKAYYKDYLQYILKHARIYNLQDLEIKYLRESFIHQLFILPEDLERYLHLISPSEQDRAMKELIESIKNTSKGYYQDKLTLLLLRANLFDELIAELSRATNKFSAAHEVALKKYPDTSPSFLALYMRHLAETLRQDSVYRYQVKVFTKAKEFLDKLPEETVIELIKKLMDQVGKAGHLYRYLNELYDYPFLKEEENY
ncbi:hypothetical protein CNR22_08180 [Sphingobacteriaceae bacterium]|nr:hypothetical protein CNR22_08180 [Sphingobacteriaceae bacterium]